MTRVDRIIRSITSWWRTVHPDRTLERIPAYRAAAEAERRALARRNTRELHKARVAKERAVRGALAGKDREMA